MTLSELKKSILDLDIRIILIFIAIVIYAILIFFVKDAYIIERYLVIAVIVSLVFQLVTPKYPLTSYKILAYTFSIVIMLIALMIIKKNNSLCEQISECKKVLSSNKDMYHENKTLCRDIKKGDLWYKTIIIK